MIKIHFKQNDVSETSLSSITDFDNERGTATLISVLIMALISAFVVVAASRTLSEAIMMSNDATETRSFYAAHGSLETMTNNFNKIFQGKISPVNSDLANVVAQTPIGFNNYTFVQNITPSDASNIVSQNVIIGSGTFSGLTALQDKWTLTTTAINRGTNQQVQLTREFLNNRVPIFQFGVFKDWDLEFHPGPQFDFGGRVHSNGNIFLLAGSTLTFQSRVTAAGEIVPDVARNGALAQSQWNGTVSIADGTTTGGIPNFVVLTRSGISQTTAGSVLNGPDITNSDPNMPDGSVNPGWATSQARFNGNLSNSQPKLVLPIKLGSANDNREIIKRSRTAATDYEVTTLGRTVDDPTLAQTRYANGVRTGGLRVSLADSQAELPPDVNSATRGNNGGVRLDLSNAYTNNSIAGATGYKPSAMSDGYQATPFNGYRLYRGASYTDRSMPTTRQSWIKIEVVTINAATGLPQSQDVTSSFLSLGLTEPATASLVGSSNSYVTTTYGTDTKDKRAIIKLQRFIVSGPALRLISGTNTPTTVSTKTTYTYSNGSFVVMTNSGSNATSSSLQSLWGLGSSTVSPNFNVPDSSGSNKELAAGVVVDSSAGVSVIPFPINMFDTREGVSNADDTTTINSYINNGTLPVNGVMSVIDVDVANLKRLIDGAFDGKFPTTLPTGEVALSSSLIPRGEGTILYVSDRRGDRDFDGEYDMEDIFGKYDGVIYAGEDINGNDPSTNITGNGILEVAGGPSSNINDLPYVWEGTKYIETGSWGRATDPIAHVIQTSTVNGSTGNFSTINSDLAALFDHRYYRRVVRLINGTQPPGGTNVSGLGTKGFSFASENGIYIKGNFNATGVSLAGTPTAAINYLPSFDLNGSTNQVPCSVVGDSVAILSNNWNDGQSFSSGLNVSGRVANETFVRTAIMAGSTLSFQLYDSSGGLMSIPNQGGGDKGLYGGVHNFPRFLENWSGISLHYCGSLICLYTSRNNNGTHKGGAEYSPPKRDWIFDASFTNASRLPPGTPFFQYVQITGFRRTNF